MRLLIIKLYYLFSRTIIKVLGLFLPIKKKILFDSFSGKQYSDNPRAISEKIHELYPDYEIVWVLRNLKDNYGIIPSYVRLVKRGKIGFSFYKELSTAFCFVVNTEIKPKIYKRKNQIFIQTWHGDRVFKKVLYQVTDGKEMEIPIMDSQYTDLCIAGSDLGEKVYKSAFKYYGEIMKVGMPRNDILLSASYDKNNIKEKLSIPYENKILLYAPTFRDNGSQIPKIDFNRILNIINNPNEKWIILKRGHLATIDGFEINCDSKFVYDVTTYPDMADLLYISDCLLTDYSSCAGDFLLTNKPIFITAFDKKDYEKNCRQLNFQIEDSGYYIVENQIELENAMKNMYNYDWDKISDNIKRFFGIKETGHSSEIISEWINNKYIEYINLQ